MDLFTRAATIITGAILIIGVVVMVVIFARGSYNKARMDALREDNKDLRDRIGDQAAEIIIERTAKEALNEQLHSRTDEATMLRELVLNRPEVEELTKELRETNREGVQALNDHAERVMKALTDHDKKSTAMGDRIERMVNELRKRNQDDAPE